MSSSGENMSTCYKT